MLRRCLSELEYIDVKHSCEHTPNKAAEVQVRLAYRVVELVEVLKSDRLNLDAALSTVEEQKHAAESSEHKQHKVKKQRRCSLVENVEQW